MNSIVTYIRESIEELHKVRWPTRRQAVRLSAITVVFVIASSLFFGAVDVALSQAMTTFLRTLF